MVYVRTGNIAPLQSRYEALCAKMCALRGAPVVPMSEEACDQMSAWIEANKPPPPPAAAPLSHTMSREIDNFEAALRAYSAEAGRLMAEQRILKRLHVQENCAALGVTIDPALFTEPVHVELVQLHLFGNRNAWRTFGDVDAARRGTALVMQAVHHLQDQRDQVEQRTRLEKLDLSLVVPRFGARFALLEARLLATETELEHLKQQKGKAHARR
jgi:hypothetical protein